MNEYTSLTDLRKSIIGSMDDYHYRSDDARNSRITGTISKRRKAVWLCSENDRYNYRGIVRLERTENGWEVDEGTEQFDQIDKPRSFAQMFRDHAEMR